MGSFHDFLVELHAEFGPVASFYYGTKYCVSLGSAETLRQVENCFDRPRESTKDLHFWSMGNSSTRFPIPHRS